MHILCRCNDVLELAQTTSHFRLLAQATEVGGAGCQCLDSLVCEIYLKFSRAMEELFSHVKNVLTMDNSQVFEKAFFRFRMVVKVSVGAAFGCCQYLIVLWQLSTVVHLQSADVHAVGPGMAAGRHSAAKLQPVPHHQLSAQTCGGLRGHEWSRTSSGISNLCLFESQKYNSEIEILHFKGT